MERTTIQLHDRGMIALMNEVLFAAEMRACAKWENANDEEMDQLEKDYDKIVEFIQAIETQMEFNREEVTLCQQ